MDVRGVQELELADGFLRTVFLHRSDEDIHDNNGDEQHIPVAADQEQAGCQREIQEIEKCKHVVKENLLQGFSLITVQHIAPAVPETFVRLLLRQAALVRICKILRPFARKLQFGSHPNTSRILSFPYYADGRRVSTAMLFSGGKHDIFRPGRESE